MPLPSHHLPHSSMYFLPPISISNSLLSERKHTLFTRKSRGNVLPTRVQLHGPVRINPCPSLSLLWISPGRIFGGLARGHSAKIDLAGPVRKRGECGVRSAQWKQRDGLSSSALSLLRICRLANRLHPRWKLGFSRLFLKSDGAVSRLLAVKWSWDFFFLETGGGGRSRKGIEEVGWFIKG